MTRIQTCVDSPSVGAVSGSDETVNVVRFHIYQIGYRMKADSFAVMSKGRAHMKKEPVPMKERQKRISEGLKLAHAAKATKKKPKRVSPTQQVMKHYRDLGYTLAITERWNPYAKIRQDLFGFIDLIAIKSGEPMIAIQATSRPNIGTRVKKILSLPAHRIWLETGARILVVGLPRIVELTIEGSSDASAVKKEE